MTDPENILDVFLQPGDIYWGDPETRIRTILGSCVAICVWHPEKKIGGMCHILMPTRMNRPTDATFNGQYADEAMHMLLLAIYRSGTKASEYTVKIFGGGNMFLAIEGKDAIGSRNIKAVRELLAAYNLKPAAESLGGNFYWRLHLDLWTGNVWVKKRPVTEYK